MKARLDENGDKRPFPKLMRHRATGCVFLFSSNGVGTVVYTTMTPGKTCLKRIYNEYFYLGHRCSNANMIYFNDYDGEVILSN